MVIPTFPTLPGLSFPVKRSPSFQTIEHKAVDGTSTTQSPQPFTIYKYELPFEFLRAANAFLEIQTLMSFYEGRLGKARPFHFSDPDDNRVVGQTIGLGDGVTTDFGLVRSMVGNAVPVQDGLQPGLILYINGVARPPTDWNALVTTEYGTMYGLHLHFTPAVGAVVSADFSYNWLCRFDEDVQEFSKIQYLNGSGLWEAKAIKFSSVLQ